MNYCGIVVSRTILIIKHDCNNNSSNNIATNADSKEKPWIPRASRQGLAFFPQASKRSVVSWNLKRMRDPLLAGLFDR